jgi:hypothetical protein
MRGNGIHVRSSYFGSSVCSRYPIGGTTTTTNLSFRRLGREAQRHKVSRLALDCQLSTLVAGSQLLPVWVGLFAAWRRRGKTLNNRILLLFLVLLYEVTAVHLGNASVLGVFCPFYVPTYRNCSCNGSIPVWDYGHALGF